jgi:hypothetical protein
MYTRYIYVGPCVEFACTTPSFVHRATFSKSVLALIRFETISTMTFVWLGFRLFLVNSAISGKFADFAEFQQILPDQPVTLLDLLN